MRYIYQEPVITTISDSEISEDQAIRDVLLNIKENQYSVAIEFHDPDFPDSIKVLDRVRVIEVGDATFDIHAFFSQSSAKYKRIPFLSVRKLKLIANKSAIAKKYRVNRWHLLDVAEVGE